MEVKKIFNHESREAFDEARIIGGNPNGIMNFNQTNHKWAKTIYDNMKARTWFPAQVSIINDVSNYLNLTEDEKRMYDLVLAQLIANDSIQTNQLMDRVNSYITSPIVNACLAVQAMEEANHSDSYAVMAEDIAKDTDRIYRMHEYDDELTLKNSKVENMYESLYTGNDPSKEDMLMIFLANQILEELVFPGGFVAMYSIDDKMSGTGAMIAEIAKDETLSHVPLFKNIFRTTVHEEFNGIIPIDVVYKGTELIKVMTDAEIRWTKYATKGVLGFSDNAIKVYIESQANSVCNNLGFPKMYKEEKNNPLGKLLKSRLRGGELETRSAFFETNVVDYSKGTLIVDF